MQRYCNAFSLHRCRIRCTFVAETKNLFDMKKTVIALALCLLCVVNMSAQITPDSTDIVITGQPIGVELFDFVDEEITGPGLRPAYYDPNNKYNAFRVGLGYQCQYFVDKCSSALKLPNGLCCTMDISYRRFYFGMNFGFEEGLLGADNFHYDRREDYNWNKGEDYTLSPISVRTGFNIINKGPVFMTTFVGLGGATIQQDTGKNSGENANPINSKIKGTSTELGIMTRSKIYRFCYPQSALEVTAGAYVSRTNFESLGTTYSLNGFLTFNLALSF